MDVKERALQAHEKWGGKIEVVARCEVNSKDDLSIAYTPGVAEPCLKIKDDPRAIPGIGKFIRRHSLDELPQFLNVLVGQMSLIGPRPALPKEVVQYDKRALRRLTVKPGCGGAWQASSRSDSTFGEMVDLDIDYIEHRSAVRDIELVLGTLRSMLDGKGAY